MAASRRTWLALWVLLLLTVCGAALVKHFGLLALTVTLPLYALAAWAIWVLDRKRRGGSGPQGRTPPGAIS